jgi:hypothetical protein
MNQVERSDAKLPAFRNGTLGSRWILISSLIFGAFAGFVKAVFLPYPDFNPPAIFPALVAFFLAALFWWWLVERGGRPTPRRGGLAGGLVGLLTPVLVWPFFLLSAALVEGRFPELFLWAPIYMYFGLIYVSWITAAAGIILGTVLGFFRRKNR